MHTTATSVLVSARVIMIRTSKVAFFRHRTLDSLTGLLSVLKLKAKMFPLKRVFALLITEIQGA
jgi:hypothetical protein